MYALNENNNKNNNNYYNINLNIIIETKINKTYIAFTYARINMIGAIQGLKDADNRTIIIETFWIEN